MAKYDVSFKVGADGAKEVLEQLEKIQKYIDSLGGSNTKIGVSTDINTKGIDGLNTKLKGAQKQAFSLSDALSQVGTAFSTAGGALQSFGSFFGADTVGTVTRTLTAYATVLASSGFAKSIDRYDTMTTFPKMMSAMGYDADKAAEAVQTLNDAVLGLPTSLSDIVEQAQNFTTITGDLEKGVQYAIAANNTFLAGGADTSQVYYGTKQLQDLMSAGELQSMEWQSLIKAMGPSWREIGKEMGYAEDELTDFRSALTGGEIDGTDFLNAMVKAATGTGKLAQMAGLSKEQVGSALTNVQTAFASTGQSIIETVNDLFQEIEGKTLAEKISGVGTWVKTELKPELNDWVTANFDGILSFIDRIASYDWTGLLTKVADATAVLFDIYTSVASKLPTSVVAGGMVLATPIGGVLSSIGSLLSGLSKLDLTKFVKFGKFADKSSGVSKGVKGVGSVMSSLKSIGTTFLGVTAFVGVVAEIGLVIKEYTGIIQSISDMKIGGNFNRNLKAVSQFMGQVSVITAGIVGTMSVLNGFGLGGIIGAGELLSAGAVGVVGLVGVVIGEYADVINQISALNLNSTSIDKNIKIIGNAVTSLNALMIGEGIVNFLTLGSSLIGAGTVSADMIAIELVVDAIDKLSKIDSADIDTSGIKKNISDLQEIIDLMTEDENVFTALSDSLIVGSMASAATNMQSVMSSWATIISAYSANSTEGVDIEGITAKIKEDASSINDAIDALTGDENPFTALFDSWTSGSMRKTVDNLKTIVEEWKEVEAQFTGATSTNEATIAAPSGTLSKESPIVRWIGDIIDEAKAVENKISGEGLEKVLSAISQALDASSSTSLTTVVTNMVTLVNGYNSLQTAATQFNVDETLSEKISGMFTQLDSMFAGIPDPDYNEITSRLSSWIMFLDQDHMLGVVNDMVTLAGTISSDGYAALNHIKTFFGVRMTDFNTSIAEIDAADFDERVQNVQHMFDRLNILLSVIKALELDEARTKINDMRTMMGEEVTGLLNSLINMQSLLDQLGASGSEIPVVAMLTNMFTGLDAAMSGESFEGFNTQLVTLSENLDAITLSLFELYNSLTEMQPVIEGYAEVMEEFLIPDSERFVEIVVGLPESIGVLSDSILLFRDGQLRMLIEDMTTLYQWVEDTSYAYEVDFVYALGVAIAQMNLTRTEVINLTEAMTNLKTSVNDCTTALKRFQQGLRTAQTQMQQAITKANALAIAINSIPSHKTITIDVVGSGASYVSTGGMIGRHGVLYRSNGGFTPRGTDTVPAMLTPGEFVMNTKAVKTMGPSFFRRLNHLDIKGAMANVSRRFNPYGYSVNNITTRDNHATVNQYITTNNEQYSYRRARRFVEAL